MRNNLKQIRESQGLEQSDVACDLDIPLSTYRSWEQGQRGLNGEKLILLAHYFKVSTDTILGSQFSELKEEVSLTPDESHLVDTYRLLDPPGQHAVMTLAEGLAQKGE